MPLPQPKVALTNVCSVIFNDTLYTYSADAFQALPLEPGAQWTQLSQGEKVTGGACVGSKTAFFVIGGASGNTKYQGIQKYTYSTKKWESVTLSDTVVQNRMGHSATYIPDSDDILVYGGGQDGQLRPSGDTYTITASAPYEIHSFARAQSAFNPILLPWSSKEAVMIGGSNWNKQVMIFNKVTDGWTDLGATLAEPLTKDVSAVKAVIVTGDDGSKHLLTFDMTVSPNVVRRTVLLSASKLPVQNSPAIKRRTSGEEEPKSERRDIFPLTMGEWPPYNSTLAPTATRTNYGLAEDANGLVVIAGGNQEDVLCMFDYRENSWQNATQRLALSALAIDDTPTTESLLTATAIPSSSISSSTSLPTTTTANAAAATQTPSTTKEVPAPSEGPNTNTILAAVLGSLFGVAMILLVIFWCMNRRRKRNAHLEAGHMRRSSGVSSDEKVGVNFANDILAHGHTGKGVFRGHQPKDSGSSFSSMAILMGRSNQQKPGQSVPSRSLTSNTIHSRRASEDSTFKAFKSTISKPMPQVAEPVETNSIPRPQLQPREDKGVSFAPNMAEPRPRNPSEMAAIDREGDTRRSSGWNRYWSGGSALNMLGFGGGVRNSNTTNAQRNTLASDRSSQSHYSNPHRITQDSATVPPLQINEPRASFSRVPARSPNIAYYNEELKEGMSAHLEHGRPVSAVSSASGYSSGIPESVKEAWDPTAADFPRPWGADRAPSSTYTTPLAPARPLTSSTRQQQQQTQQVRDDMSWLNLGS
ncbi:hypothetical protein B0H63DRAFT_58867 [Podospora didyma]|uniref:Pre-mRNA splicing factor CLF1 n=1 Tax=Podospora didyma TaxID=330526 RepID=A0AAE0P7I0_9PEZI|nr:hypothetical protein B0H63DRAFT_58867 [Podospora didyma]